MKVEDLSKSHSGEVEEQGFCTHLTLGPHFPPAHYPMKRTQPIHLASLILAWALADMRMSQGWCLVPGKNQQNTPLSSVYNCSGFSLIAALPPSLLGGFVL